MRKILYALLVVCASFSSFAQKALLGINSGDEYNDPASYFGNITQYDIDGENPLFLHEFDSIQGYVPKGKLFFASNGKLYGTTVKGGNFVFNGTQNETAGVLFEYDLIFDQYRVIHYFEFDNNGRIPDIGVIEPTQGVLVGATNNRIFKYEMASENITFSNPIGFSNGIHGALTLASDGNIYGTSYAGNCSGQIPDQPLLGNILKYNMASNQLTFVHSIYCDPVSEGAFPNTQLIEVTPGKLMGTTYNGGANMFSDPYLRGGTLFEFNINTNVFTKKIDFEYTTTGVHPLDLVKGDTSKLYGMCNEGGLPQTCNNPTYNFGTLYEYTPATNTLEVKQHFSFCGNSVRYPSSLMKISNGNFIGTIPGGGLFKYDADANQIIMPTYTNSNINLYNAANLIEICRMPSYQKIVVDTFDACVGSTFTYNIQNTNATAYQWMKDGVNVTAQTTGILNLTNLTAADAGNYTCLMTNECGTTTTMALHLSVNCLGINTVANLNNAVKLYPNPASEWLNIELPQNIDVTVASCTLTNLLGQTVSQIVTNNKINVSFLQQGVYIVSLETNYGKWNGKFIKQ